MNKKILLLTISALLFSCGNNSSSSFSSSKEDSSTLSSVEEHESSTSTLPESHPSSNVSESEVTSSNEETSSTISSESSSNVDVSMHQDLPLHMYGDLYFEAMRTIYAMPKDSSKNIIWSSSNEDIVDVSVRDNLSSECTLIGRNYGEAIITAQYEDDASVVSHYRVRVEEGTAMPEDLFAKFTSSMKVVTEDICLSYDTFASHQEKVDTIYDCTTIYEEYDTENLSEDNHTDAYSLEVRNRANNQVTFQRKYVKGVGSYVATEYINFYNEISTQNYVSEEGEQIKFNSSYYVNLYKSSYFSHENFRTFDGGKTYHWVGGYIYPTYFVASLLLIDSSPDDFYFGIDGDNLTINADIDPYNKEVSARYKYGRSIRGVVSEIKTATIEHLQPYQRQDYHNNIQAAFDEIIEGKNYSVSYTLDYKEGVDYRYEFIFTDYAVDQKVYGGSQLITHTGIYKDSEETYIGYEFDETDTYATITKTYNKPFHSVNQYPTFDFSEEIFTIQNDGSYITGEKHGLIIAKSFYLPSNISVYGFNSPVTISLDEGGHLKTMSTIIDEFGDDLRFDAIFSNIGTSTFEINFEEAVVLPGPQSFDEENPKLAEELRGWNMYDALPYLYPENGYDMVAWRRDNNASHGIDYTYLTTNDFTNEKLRDKFIEDYKALLVKNGYTASSLTNKVSNDVYYEKDGFYVAVGIEKNWNDNPLLSAIIYVKSEHLINYYYQTSDFSI